MVRLVTAAVVTLTATFAHDFTPSLDASFFHDHYAWAKCHSGPRDQTRAAVTAVWSSGIAHDILDTKPREPTSVQNQPGQQPVAFLRWKVVL